MEVIALRFSHLSEGIFNLLNNESIAKCRKVSRFWNQFLDNDKQLWIRIIKSYEQNQAGFEEEWKSVIEKVPLETAKELAVATQKFYKTFVF